MRHTTNQLRTLNEEAGTLERLTHRHLYYVWPLLVNSPDSRFEKLTPQLQQKRPLDIRSGHHRNRKALLPQWLCARTLAVRRGLFHKRPEFDHVCGLAFRFLSGH
jgi:hypothetical protein